MSLEMQKFAKFVKEKREAVGLSAPQLAMKVWGQKHRRNYINEIENGTRTGITLETMEQILNGLNTVIRYEELPMN